jgi:hypothetical protein
VKKKLTAIPTSEVGITIRHMALQENTIEIRKLMDYSLFIGSHPGGH